MNHIRSKILLRYSLVVLLILALSGVALLSSEDFQLFEAISALVLVSLVPIVALGVALLKRKR